MSEKVEDFLTKLSEEEFDTLIEVIEEVIREDFKNVSKQGGYCDKPPA